ITNLAGAPTAYRMMMAADAEQMAQLRGKLRVVSSAGEPLNPEVIRWFKEVLDVQFMTIMARLKSGWWCVIIMRYNIRSVQVRQALPARVTGLQSSMNKVMN